MVGIERATVNTFGPSRFFVWLRSVMFSFHLNSKRKCSAKVPTLDQIWGFWRESKRLSLVVGGVSSVGTGLYHFKSTRLNAGKHNELLELYIIRYN